MKNKIFILSLIITAANIPFAFAVDVPSRDTAGAEQQRFEENSEFEQQSQNAQARLSQNDDVNSTDSDEAADAADTGPKFELKQIKFSGNEQFSNEALQAVVKEFIGQQVSLNGLKRVASKVKQFYRERGYVAAYVYIPPQDATGGIVELQIIEGKLGTIEIKGNKWFSERTIRRMSRLHPGSVIYYNDLRSALSFFNKNRDLKVTSLLKPGREPKTTDVELNVKDKFPVHLSTDVNNLGTTDTGKDRWGVTLGHTNLLGLMDELSTRFQIGDGSVGTSTRYTVPLHSSGTLLTLGYSYSHVNLQNEFKPLNIEGNAHTYSFDISQPVYQKMLPEDIFMELSVHAGMDFKSIENKVLNAVTGKDEFRILNVGGNAEFTDKWGKLYLPQNFSWGFADFLGASDVHETAASRSGTGGQFFVYRGQAIRYNRLPYDMLLTLRGSWQATPDDLPSSEQFHLGGAFSVRGYSESAYLADYGGIFSTEVMIPSYIFPEDWKLPFSSLPLRKQIQGVAFFDMGAGGIRHPLTGEADSRTLSGLGGGVRIHLFDRMYGRFQWAGRTGQKVGSGSDSAFYYGISAELF